MAVDTTYNFNLYAQYEGQAVSTANSPVYASPSGATAPTWVNLGTAQAPVMAMRASAPAGSQSSVQFAVSGDAGGGFSLAMRGILRSVASAVGYFLEPRIAGAGGNGRVMLSTARACSLYPSGAQVGSAFTLPLDTELIFRTRINPGPTGTGDGANQLVISSADDATVHLNASTAAANITAGLVTQWYAGNLTTTQALTFDFWAPHVRADAYDLIDPSPILTGDAGADQTVSALQTVTLTGTGTGTWSQLSGTPVTLLGSGSTRSYVAPATLNGDTLVFGFGGDTRTDIVLPHVEWAWTRAGVLVPKQFRL